MRKYDPTIKPVRSDVDGTITSIPLEAFMKAFSANEDDMIVYTMPKSRALTITCGRLEQLTKRQCRDLMRIWTHALAGSSYETSVRYSYDVLRGLVTYERRVCIDADIESFFYLPSIGIQTKPAAEDIISCAKEAGVEYMVDSYFSEVPIEHIIG